jgi:D-glycero-D-manno-heptose 1,7-bisphosphate phosphatase
LLDRDGVVNVDRPDYTKSPEEWQALPGSLHAIAQLQAAGYALAVCTNQAGIGRGMFSAEQLGRIHSKLNDQLISNGGRSLDVFYCPHHPQDGCTCRKPLPELLDTAMRATGFEATQTVYVGDSEKDLLAADNAKCDSVLVLTGKGQQTAMTERGRKATCYQDLAAFSRTLLPT